MEHEQGRAECPLDKPKKRGIRPKAQGLGRGSASLEMTVWLFTKSLVQVLVDARHTCMHIYIYIYIW